MKKNNLNASNAEDLASIVQGPGRGKKRRLTRVVIPVLLLAGGLTAWLTWSRRAEAQDRPSPFVTEPLKRGSIGLTVTATGNLEPTNEVTVGSELSGITLDVYVDINDHVTKGQPLAKLDTRKLSEQTESSRAQVSSARAKVEQAQATVKESEADLLRLRDLSKVSSGRAVSKADMDAATAKSDRAKADLVSAESAVGEAEAQVRINESDLAKAVIKSPIDGIVLTRSLEPGQTVAASFTAPELFVIAEKLEHMKLKVAVAEADIGRVAQGQKALFTVDAWPDRSYSATVTRVSYGSAVTDNVVTYETELEVSNDDLSLRPGMTATADIQVAEGNNVLMVPAAALRFDPSALAASGGGGAPEKSFVQKLMPGPPRRGGAPKREDPPAKKAGGGGARIWVLRGKDQPEPLEVKQGINDGKYIEISGPGVEEGLPVIIRANSAPAS